MSDIIKENLEIKDKSVAQRAYEYAKVTKDKIQEDITQLEEDYEDRHRVMVEMFVLYSKLLEDIIAGNEIEEKPDLEEVWEEDKEEDENGSNDT